MSSMSESDWSGETMLELLNQHIGILFHRVAHEYNITPDTNDTPPRTPKKQIWHSDNFREDGTTIFSCTEK